MKLNRQKFVKFFSGNFEGEKTICFGFEFEFESIVKL